MNPSSERREVRVSSAFFEMLDLQLRPDRGPNGEPSATDFLVIDLPEIVDAFVVGFDELPEVVEGLGSARVYIGAGALVSGVAVYGVEIADGVVELIGVEIDP
ncbi:MAG: hypothetical protein R8F63_00820 [Acidimicrobiales bacterium]|nr:hypothetical protein [Acidimicrobiales bacterium]